MLTRAYWSNLFRICSKRSVRGVRFSGCWGRRQDRRVRPGIIPMDGLVVLIYCCTHVYQRNIIFTLEKRNKNGFMIVENVPIRMRVIYNGKRVEFTTGYRIDVVKWDKVRDVLYAKVYIYRINGVTNTSIY